VDLGIVKRRLVNPVVVASSMALLWRRAMTSCSIAAASSLETLEIEGRAGATGGRDSNGILYPSLTTERTHCSSVKRSQALE